MRGFGRSVDGPYAEASLSRKSDAGSQKTILALVVEGIGPTRLISAI